MRQYHALQLWRTLRFRLGTSTVQRDKQRMTLVTASFADVVGLASRAIPALEAVNTGIADTVDRAVGAAGAAPEAATPVLSSGMANFAVTSALRSDLLDSRSGAQQCYSGSDETRSVHLFHPFFLLDLDEELAQ